MVEITQLRQQTKTQIEKKKWKQYKRPMGWYKVCQSTYNRVPGEEREKGIENVFEDIMAEKSKT